MSRLLICFVLFACILHVSYCHPESVKAMTRSNDDFDNAYSNEGGVTYYGDDGNFDDRNDDTVGDDFTDDEYIVDDNDFGSAETFMNHSRAPTVIKHEPVAGEVASSPTEAPAVAVEQSSSSYPTIFVTDERRSSKPAPTLYPTVVVDISTISSRSMRPTPSAAPTFRTKHTTSPTQRIIFNAKYSDSSLQSIKYLAYTVGFFAIAGGLVAFVARYSTRHEVSYTRVHMPEGGNIDDDESHGETEMSNIAR